MGLGADEGNTQVNQRAVPTNVIDVTCLACGCDEWSGSMLITSFRGGPDRAEFRYCVCRRCASVTLADRVDPGPYYESGDYYSHRGAATGKAASVVTRALGILHDRVGAHLLGRREELWWPPHPSWAAWFRGTGVRRHSAILDVGCGTGSLLMHLARFGFDNLTGIDPYMTSEHCDRGIALRRLALSEVGGSFDAVLFSHSLEHVDHPREQLVTASRVLSPGGVIVVGVPITGGASFRLFGVHWVAFDAPVHRFIPSVEGMHALARSAGLRVLRWHGGSNLVFYRGSLLLKYAAAARDGADVVLSPRELDWCRRQVRSERGPDSSQATFVLSPG